MRKIFIILALFITFACQSQDWIKTEAEDLYIALEYYEDDFFIHFDLSTSTEKLDQFSTITIGLIGGATLPYHFNQGEEIDLRYEALSLPLPLNTFMDIKSNGAIEYLRINDVMYPLSENDRGFIVTALEQGLF